MVIKNKNLLLISVILLLASISVFWIHLHNIDIVYNDLNLIREYKLEGDYYEVDVDFKINSLTYLYLTSLKNLCLSLYASIFSAGLFGYSFNQLKNS